MSVQNTQASHWFKKVEDLRALIDRAQAQASKENEMNFAGSMNFKARNYGLSMYISVKQLEWLCNIAKVDVPLPVSLDVGGKT